MASKFRYAAGFRAPVPAHKVGPELFKLADGRGIAGLQPDEVVKAAESSRSPLHKIFEWDNGRAGHEFRLEQARRLIRHIRVTITYPNQKPKEVRVFFNLKDGEGYRRIVEIEKEEDLRTRMLTLAAGEVASARSKLAELKGMGEVSSLLAKAESEIRREISTKPSGQQKRRKAG